MPTSETVVLVFSPRASAEQPNWQGAPVAGGAAILTAPGFSLSIEAR
jgi:hypothetical protein